MIIECHKCNANVNAEILARQAYGDEWEGDVFQFLFLKCPVCSQVMVGKAYAYQDTDGDWEFERPDRLWPDPAEQLHYGIPSLVRNSLDEAAKCLKAQAFSACAVMCGRAIEAVCAEFKTNSKTLAAGLKELKDRGVIDQRLFEWGESLREQRNMGAHATGEVVSHEDAKDLIDFSIAICQYVFVLSEKHEEFKQRQSKKAKHQKSES